MRNVSRAWRLVAVLSVLVCAIAAAWLVTAHRTAEKVSSSWALRCEDSRGSAVAVSKIQVRASWRCAVHLRVSNASGHTVRVRQVGMPYAGTTSGLMRAQSSSTARAQNANHGTRDARLGDRDAVYALDLAVPARASRTLSLPVVAPSTLCNSAGETTLPSWPEVTVSAWRRTFTRATPQTLHMVWPEGMLEHCS